MPNNKTIRLEESALCVTWLAPAYTFLWNRIVQSSKALLIEKKHLADLNIPVLFILIQMLYIVSARSKGKIQVALSLSDIFIMNLN
jgi:hypothetical protein